MSKPRAIAVYGSSMTKLGTPEWIEAEVVGGLLAEAGLAVVTGGYGGTMEAASKGAAEAGGHVIGVTVSEIFSSRSGANPYVIESIEAVTLTDRIGSMVERAVGTIALPGSIGTAAELLVSWNINHIVRRNGGTHLPCVAVGHEWRKLSRILVDQIGATEGDIHHADSGKEAVSWMIDQVD